MLGPARPPITSVEEVLVYQEPPRRFEEVAIVEGKSLAELRAKAAEVGANGVLATGIVQKPGPVIGVGLGSSSVRYGRRSAVGFGTGVSFGIPIGSNVLSGTAIYVPRRR
jgi:hypothetical protein